MLCNKEYSLLAQMGCVELPVASKMDMVNIKRTATVPKLKKLMSYRNFFYSGPALPVIAASKRA
jgi:hypothetical protein